MDEILEVANRKELAETGGGHNQKGIDFQRHWAVMRMFELMDNGTTDFLFLFESVQDVAEVDSYNTPTAIRIYQVKKKDRGEWTWNDLTKFHDPTKKRANPPPLQKIKDSPLGKLYASVLAFKTLKSSGRFISNGGCDLPLAGGTNAATSLPCDLSGLSAAHLDLLKKGLETLHSAGMPQPDLSRLQVERVALPPDDPGTHLVGVACRFLQKRSQRHAGQAPALVDALLAKIGPLGAKTSTCKTFDEMRRERGFSRAEFTEALGALENIPDLLEHLYLWLAHLAQEGMTVWEQTAIRTAAARILRDQLLGVTAGPLEDALLLDCDKWLDANPPSGSLSEYCAKAVASLSQNRPSLNKSELFATFALRAVKKCVAPI